MVTYTVIILFMIASALLIPGFLCVHCESSKYNTTPYPISTRNEIWTFQIII